MCPIGMIWYFLLYMDNLYQLFNQLLSFRNYSNHRLHPRPPPLKPLGGVKEYTLLFK